MAVRLPASFEVVNTDQNELSTAIEYKSGAIYEGNTHEYSKEGNGTFTWPNGAQYEGSFHKNRRHGYGMQKWGDGDSYQGSYIEDFRHGKGIYKWKNGDVYKGCFYKDHRHGYGKYTWSDGSYYLGTFYLDKKEGYGKFVYQNGNVFEGLYKDDERFGPGVLTYPDGKQDVGLWRHLKLVKLSNELPNAFSLKDCPDVEYDESSNRNMYFDVNAYENPLFELLKNIVDPPEELDYNPEATATMREKVESAILKETDSQSEGFDREGSKTSFVKMQEETPNLDTESFAAPEEQCASVASISNMSDSSDDKQPATLLAWNNSPAIIELQKHVHNFKYAQSRVSYNIDNIIGNERSAFKETGPLEEASYLFIKSSTEGDLHAVKKLICDGSVDPNVADKFGRTALFGAAINWHLDIVNILLDSGADINILTDEGLSSLNACMLSYYPIDKFQFNTAESPQQIYPTEDLKKKNILMENDNGKEHKEQKADKVENDKSGVKPGSKPKSRGKSKSEEAVAETESQKNSKFEGSLTKGKKKVLEFAANSEYWKIEKIIDPESDSFHSNNELEMTTDEFESQKSLTQFPINVPGALLERCATELSHNEMVVSRSRISSVYSMDGQEKVRKMAIEISQQEIMSNMIHLLLRRGADPNTSSVPMPALYFAVKAMDVEMVRELLLRGVDANIILPSTKSSLSALHIAVALPGDAGVQMTELLLDSLAQPDARTVADDSYLDRKLEEEWSRDSITSEQESLLGGRTPLHIVCARDDDYKKCHKIVRLLLRHKASTNLLCNGHSPLTLCIASGNDLAVDELLRKGADPSLALSHGVGSALCAASSTEYESRRSVEGQINLINKLVKAGGDILAPIPIGPKRTTGTAVDYAYHIYNLDRRIAHMPYHALTLTERDVYNARRRLLTHVGNVLREKAVERERLLMEAGDTERLMRGSAAGASSVMSAEKAEAEGENFLRQAADASIRRGAFKYCYDCGRSVGVRLSACTRCKEVYFCGKACKLKAWNARHKDECIRVGGRAESSKTRSNQIDSPTPITDADRTARKSKTNKEFPQSKPKKKPATRR